MKIAIMGTGGVGGYYGGLLARAGHDVTFIARGEHMGAIREKGLELEASLAISVFSLPQLQMIRHLSVLSNS